jgi:demethylmenaquinone methyltransferase/2-methoxy-6-polyprenyl-1,4-benzoquinol methylase
MFAAIAPSYDLNNRLHSAWIDQHWRRRAVKFSRLTPTDHVLDVACGTGDLTLAFAHARPASVTGTDFTYEMLPIARSKAASQLATRNSQLPLFTTGDAQALPFPDASFDVVSIAFGIRNVQDPLTALKEFRRVLRPGGRVIVLEFSVPTNPLFRAVYNFYSAKVMPLTATWLSGDRSGAYKYLPHSVETFLTPPQMLARLQQAGFSDLASKPLTFGTVTLYRGFTTA